MSLWFYYFSKGTQKNLLAVVFPDLYYQHIISILILGLQIVLTHGRQGNGSSCKEQYSGPSLPIKKNKNNQNKKKIIKNQNKKIDKTKKILFMGLQNLTLSGGGEGGAAGSHKFLFSTGQIFCQKILSQL